MRPLEIIEYAVRRLKAQENVIDGVKIFLYGDDPSAKKISQAAIDCFRPFENDNTYEFIGAGGNTLVIGNASQVIKIESGPLEPQDYDYSLKTEEVPAHLTAKVLASGSCNGRAYTVCERLNTKLHVTLEEIIPFLFKARDAGVVYWDPQGANFSYDKDGKLKVLDHEHFEKIEQPAGNFAKSLNDAIENFYDQRFPTIAFDDRNTYVILDPKMLGKEAYQQQQKRLLTSLESVGIPDSEIEVVETTPVIRIARTEIRYGTPPKTEELADYIDKAMKEFRTQAPRPAPKRDTGKKPNR